jgi:hypothetical protein
MPDGTSIVVNDRSYNLTERPSYDDPLVQSQVSTVLGQLSLNEVTDNLYLCVELIFVAYNGVAGAQGGKIQADVAGLQSKLALLCNDCLLTMTTFKSETDNIISELLSTYKWLTKGQESLALKKLAGCKTSSKTMADEAQKLADRFTSLQTDSTTVRSNTIEVEASEHDKQLAAEAAQREIRAKQMAQKANQVELASQISTMDALYNDAKQREEKAQSNALILGITSAVTGAIGAGVGAYAAARNPLSGLGGGAGSGGASSSTESGGAAAPSPEFAEAKKTEEEKKAASNEAQQKLLSAQADVDTQTSQVNKLKSELKAATDAVSSADQGDAEKLKTLTDARNSKEAELESAESALGDAKKKVEPLEKDAADRTAEYAASGKALLSLAQSTGQMSKAAATAEESIYQEKMKYLNAKLDLDKQKRESLVALAQYAEDVKNLQVVEGQAKISVSSLHAAVSALGKIVGALTNASLFWNQMAKYCDRMTDQGFQKDIADVTGPGGLSKEDRVAYYLDTDFMKEFLGYLCQWVALNGLSGDYLVKASTAQQRAVAHLRDSPEIEKALQQAPQLAADMETMLGQSMAQIAKSTADLEQQKALLARPQ